MTRLVFVAALTPCLFPAALSYAGEPGKPFRPMSDQVGIHYSGTVTDVTKNSITVQWPGENPKRFQASDALAAGSFSTKPRPSPMGTRPYDVDDSECYRLEDVKVGDQVGIRYAHLGDTDICDHIRINRRPGGRIPPLPEGAITPKKRPPGLEGLVFLSDIPYHERMNAYWDLEERGIPYPAKFGKHRRFPIAPMPREK